MFCIILLKRNIFWRCSWRKWKRKKVSNGDRLWKKLEKGNLILFSFSKRAWNRDVFERPPPPFSFRAEMKKNRDSFLIKNRENLTKFYQKFCFFQKFKFIHFTEALEIFFNFLSMTIIDFDVLNNELRWNSLENNKLREIFENIFPVFSLSRFFLPPPLFVISTPVWHVLKNRDCTRPYLMNLI
mgnify:CR=1 FL=1